MYMCSQVFHVFQPQAAKGNAWNDVSFSWENPLAKGDICGQTIKMIAMNIEHYTVAPLILA